jgi:hypothetical protein
LGEVGWSGAEGKSGLLKRSIFVMNGLTRRIWAKKEGRLPLDGLQPNPNTKQTLNYGAEDAAACSVFKKFRRNCAFTRL